MSDVKSLEGLTIKIWKNGYYYIRRCLGFRE